jgi:hypothetical protein
VSVLMNSLVVVPEASAAMDLAQDWRLARALVIGGLGVVLARDIVQARVQARVPGQVRVSDQAEALAYAEVQAQFQAIDPVRAQFQDRDRAINNARSEAIAPLAEALALAIAIAIYQVTAPVPGEEEEVAE